MAVSVRKSVQLTKKMILKWSVLILLLFISGISCDPSGYLYPKYNIISKTNSTVELFCSLNEANETFNSDLLSFIGNYNYQDNVEIVNATTIKLTLRNVQPMKDTISCVMNKTHGVGLRTITIGTPPEEVKNFSCESHDFEYMLCHFESPYNFVKPTYDLSYQVESSGYNCTLHHVETTKRIECNITLEEGKYRVVHDIYNFTLISENSLGPARSDNYIISNFDSAIPGNSNFNTTSITTNSAVLEWHVKYLFTKKGILYVVKYVSQYNNDKWVTLIKNGFQNSEENSIEITGLKPYTWYTVQLDMKSFNAVNSDLYWTKTNKTFQTSPAKPNDPPKVDIGSFEKKYHSNSTIRTCNIYWSRVPETEYNGPNIDERIKNVRKNQRITNVNFREKTDYSATYELENADYEFTLHTVNNEGESVNGSTLRVPNEDYPAPRFLKKIYMLQGYNIMWSEPEKYNNSNLILIDYTLFQCKARTETSEECKSGFNFTRVDKHERNQSIPSKDQMNFAVSANYYHNVSGSVSSGMVWAQCTASANSDLLQVNLIDSRPLNGSTILLGWKLDCVPSTVVKGFRLKYCPLVFKTYSCAETVKSLNISGEKVNYTLNGLKSYTTYGIWMNMYSETKEGPYNINTKEVTTLESKPSTPRRLQITGKTAFTLSLRWETPKSMNGKLRFYTIYYNEFTVKVEEDHLANKSAITYELKDLYSYKQYTITVTASTTEESERSNDCVETTKASNPGPPESTLNPFTLTWKPPKLMAGPGIDYYEVKTETSSSSEYTISRIKNLKCTMSAISCNGFSQNVQVTYKFSVRAVNVMSQENVTNPTDKNEVEAIDGISTRCEEETAELSAWYNENKETKTHLQGSWSSPHQSTCSPPSIAYASILIGLGALITVMISYLASKKYVQMKDISIKFPPGLTDLDQESNPKGCDNIIIADDMAQLLKGDRYLTNLSDIKSKPMDYDVSPTVVVCDEDCSSGHADSVEMSDMSDTSNNSPTDSPNMSLRQMPKQSPPQSNAAMKPVIVNGYVQHQSLFPNLPSNDYTQMDAPENPIIPTNVTTTDNDSSKQKDLSSLNSGAQENISGYVTHKQLSVFGLSQQ